MADVAAGCGLIDVETNGIAVDSGPVSGHVDPDPFSQIPGDGVAFTRVAASDRDRSTRQYAAVGVADRKLASAIEADDVVPNRCSSPVDLEARLFRRDET